MADNSSDDEKMPEKSPFAASGNFDDVKDEMMNNNNKFHMNTLSEKKFVFPKRARVDLQFEDIYYNVKEWSWQKPIPGTWSI